MQSNDAAERLLHHDDIATGRKLSNFEILSIENGGLYCGHPEHHQRRSGYQTGSPQLHSFNRTDEEVTANMEETESRELDEQ